MKKIKLFILAAFVVLGVGATLVPQNAGAITALPQCDTDATLNSGVDASDVCAKKNENVDSYVTKIVKLLLLIIGLLSVVMLIFGGIRYVLSAGDSSKLTSAKNTILYAIVGLVIAILAGVIVQFALASVLNGNVGAKLNNAKTALTQAKSDEASAAQALQDAQAAYATAVQTESDSPSDDNAAAVTAKGKLVDTAQATEKKTSQALQDATEAEAALEKQNTTTKK